MELVERMQKQLGIPIDAWRPRWKTQAECSHARHVAAYEEAKTCVAWPILVRVGLQAPLKVPPGGEIGACRSEIAKLGGEIVSRLVALQAKRKELEELETRELVARLASLSPGARELHARAFPTKPVNATVNATDPLCPIDEAIGLVCLHAGFARYKHEGKSSLQARGGRPPVPARGRVAARYASGWTDLHEGTTWSPTARDLALLAICEGANDLPDSWQVMTTAALIGSEERAMRPYLRATGKK